MSFWLHGPRTDQTQPNDLVLCPGLNLVLIFTSQSQSHELAAAIIPFCVIIVCNPSKGKRGIGGINLYYWSLLM